MGLSFSDIEAAAIGAAKRQGGAALKPVSDLYDVATGKAPLSASTAKGFAADLAKANPSYQAGVDLRSIADKASDALNRKAHAKAAELGKTAGNAAVAQAEKAEGGIVIAGVVGFAALLVILGLSK